MKAILAALALALVPLSAHAQAVPANAPWIVIGDSIVSFPHGGTPNDLPFTIIGQNRNVAFPMIASPAAAIGSTGMSGFNSTWTTDTLDHICGYFWYCSGVVIQAGVNDFQLGNSWESQQTSIRRVLDWALLRNKRVLMLDMIYSRDAEVGSPTNAAGLTFAQIRNARFMECYARAPRCWFAARPPEFSRLTPGYYQADGLHLTPTGRAAMPRWIEREAAAARFF